MILCEVYKCRLKVYKMDSGGRTNGKITIGCTEWCCTPFRKFFQLADWLLYCTHVIVSAGNNHDFMEWCFCCNSLRKEAGLIVVVEGIDNDILSNHVMV